MGSTASRIEFSSIDGIKRASKGEESSRHGLVFTSIKKTLNCSSIMKSSPKHYINKTATKVASSMTHRGRDNYNIAVLNDR